MTSIKPTQPTTPPKRPKRKLLFRRLRNSLLVTSTFLAFSLGGGMWGYHHFARLSWTDAFLNASMILSGMGPVSPLESEGSKIFAGFYALYSGGAFLIAMAVLMAPILHHFFKEYDLDKVD